MRPAAKKVLVAILRRTGGLATSFRIYEFLKGLHPCTAYRNIRYRKKIDSTGIPVPPARHIVSVIGHPNIQIFVESGRGAVATILAALARNGIDVRDFGNMLEFGCGCGRVIRHWPSLCNSPVFGTDYNQELIEWCRSHLTGAHFETNRLCPPLHFGAASFDFVYALSVFTHLSEPLQHQWMAELSRVLKPGGYLLITTYGMSHLNELTQGQKIRFQAGHMVVQCQEMAGTNMCRAFHPEEFVMQTLAGSLEVIDSVPDGHHNQDMYLLKKPVSRES
jgi:SAM-dependent methyltransferase